MSNHIDSTPPRVSAGSFGATAFADFPGEFVALELMGVWVDDGFDRTCADGDVTLDRTKALSLIRSLGTALGKPEETEAFLATTFDPQD